MARTFINRVVGLLRLVAYCAWLIGLAAFDIAFITQSAVGDRLHPDAAHSIPCTINAVPAYCSNDQAIAISVAPTIFIVAAIVLLAIVIILTGLERFKVVSKRELWSQNFYLKVIFTLGAFLLLVPLTVMPIDIPPKHDFISIFGLVFSIVYASMIVFFVIREWTRRPPEET